MKNKLRVALALVLLMSACTLPKEESNKGSTKPVPLEQFNFVKDELNKKILVDRENYYKLRIASDTTVQLSWGNSSFEKTYEDPIEIIFAERLRVQWKNKDYIILRYGTGTGAWTNIVLPLNKEENAKVFNNALCFDKDFNLLGTEELSDTVFIVHNLKTNNKQFIVEINNPCESASSTACVDTIGIKDKILYYRWITPHKYSSNKTAFERQIQIKI